MTTLRRILKLSKQESDGDQDPNPEIMESQDMENRNSKKRGRKKKYTLYDSEGNPIRRKVGRPPKKNRLRPFSYDMNGHPNNNLSTIMDKHDVNGSAQINNGHTSLESIGLSRQDSDISELNPSYMFQKSYDGNTGKIKKKRGRPRKYPLSTETPPPPPAVSKNISENSNKEDLMNGSTSEISHEQNLNIDMSKSVKSPLQENEVNSSINDNNVSIVKSYSSPRLREKADRERRIANIEPPVPMNSNDRSVDLGISERHDIPESTSSFLNVGRTSSRSSLNFSGKSLRNDSLDALDSMNMPTVKHLNSTLPEVEVDRESLTSKEDVNWVQCDKCKKWYELPKDVDHSSLPKEWYCEMITWNNEDNSFKCRQRLQSKHKRKRSTNIVSKHTVETFIHHQKTGVALNYQHSSTQRGGNNDDGEPEDQWVQCDMCKKWRKIPSIVNTSKLPVKWFCYLNVYDPLHNSCNSQQERYTDRTEYLYNSTSPLHKKKFARNTVSQRKYQRKKSGQKMTSIHMQNSVTTSLNGQLMDFNEENGDNYDTPASSGRGRRKMIRKLKNLRRLRNLRGASEDHAYNTNKMIKSKFRQRELDMLYVYGVDERTLRKNKRNPHTFKELTWWHANDFNTKEYDNIQREIIDSKFCNSSLYTHVSQISALTTGAGASLAIRNRDTKSTLFNQMHWKNGYNNYQKEITDSLMERVVSGSEQLLDSVCHLKIDQIISEIKRM